MEKLQQLNLSNEDFKLMIDGLDALPKVATFGDMMGDLLIGMLSKGDPDSERKAIENRERKKMNIDEQRLLLEENIKILQRKLLMLKRYLIEQDALKETNNIINNFR